MLDEMLTGVRSQVAIKIFGDDLEQLRKLSEQMARIVKSTPGARDIRIERLSGQQELTIDIDRRAIARHGLNVSDVNEIFQQPLAVNLLHRCLKVSVDLICYCDSQRDSVMM